MLRSIKAWGKKTLTETIPKWSQNSNVLAGLYYTFLSDRFHREHRAVLTGKVKYIERSRKYEDDRYFLSRSIHRLEKGLLMQPRKDIFALGYIESTVEAYIRSLENSEGGKFSEQQIWARDVLSHYFESITHNSLTTKLYKKLKLSTESAGFFEKEALARVPKPRARYNNNKVEFNSLYELCLQRRSVRWFLEKPVPRSLIDQAITAALQAPSACNRQPFKYYVIDNPSALQQVRDMPMGTRGYSHSIQAMIVAVGQLDAYSQERDRHLIYIDTSLANMLLMLALETLGLGSCPINWPDIEEREVNLSRFLNLPIEQRPVMMIGIGYPDPDGGIAYSQKQPVQDVRSFI